MKTLEIQQEAIKILQMDKKNPLIDNSTNSLTLR